VKATDDAASSPAGTALVRRLGPPESAVERATAEVRHSILSGRLAPAQLFSISELASQLGMSHIPVREALRRLESNGLVVLRPGRNAMVAQLDRRDVEAIYRMRRRLEPDMSVEAAAKFTGASIARLYAILDDQWRAQGPADELWMQHCSFHEALLEPALTPWDRRILNQLWHASERYTRIAFETFDMSDEDWARRVERHRALVDAVSSGSAESVRVSVLQHLEHSEQACLAIFPSL